MNTKGLRIVFALALALSVLGISTPAAANGAAHTHFTAYMTSLCFTAQPDPRCQWGEVTVLPNGKTIVEDFVNVIRFTAEDDRFTGVGIVTIRLAPGGPQGFPFHGTWIFTPDNYDGYWEGVMAERVTPEGEDNQFSAHGHGALEGLLLMGSARDSLSACDVEIIELPAYSQ